jgi:hypothetical protein
MWERRNVKQVTTAKQLSSHLPVYSWPPIVRLPQPPARALPVPKRAKRRRPEPRVAPIAERIVHHIPDPGDHVRRIPRRPPPPLRPGKRQQPQRSGAQPAPMVIPEERPPTKRTNEPRQLQAPTFAPMVQAQGKRLMAPTARVDFHPFSETLREWETGVPVDCGEPWTWETIEAAVEKGAHKSATTEESIALIEEDVAYQVKAGYAQIIPWEDL